MGRLLLRLIGSDMTAGAVAALILSFLIAIVTVVVDVISGKLCLEGRNGLADTRCLFNDSLLDYIAQESGGVFVRPTGHHDGQDVVDSIVFVSASLELELLLQRHIAIAIAITTTGRVKGGQRNKKENVLLSGLAVRIRLEARRKVCGET